MNMISTGAFQTEMDASNKQPTLAEKFAAVWEKKNAKVARAGGVSLMALSLAACGSDDATTTTTTTTTDTTTDTTTTTTPTVDAAKTLVYVNNVIDVLVGGTGDDTFIGDSNTTTAGDTADGGDGNDTVKIYGTTVTGTIKNVENLEIHHATAADFNIATGDLSGVTHLVIDGATINDKTVTLAVGDSLGVVDATGANKDINIAGTVVNAAISLENSGDSTNAIDLDFTGASIDTVTLTSTGALTTNYASLNTSGANTIATVNITASGKGLNIEDIADATTIDASTSTAPVNLDTAVNKVTITGGSGKDDITFDHANTVAIETTTKLGAGDDKLTLTSSNTAGDLVDNKVTLDGGDGTDTLTMLNAMADALTDLSAANFAKKGITGFETIAVSDITTNDALDLTLFGATSIDLAAGQGQDNTFTVLDGTTLALGAAGSAATDTATITVKGSADAGRNSDTFTLKLDAAHAGGTIVYGEASIANVETINIVSTTAKTTALVAADVNEMDLVIANATKVVVTGAANLDIDADPFDGVVSTFDASAATGFIKVSFAGGSAVTATGSATAVNTIVGSSNADLITGGAGGDTITGGNGNDIIQLGAAGKADTISLNEITAAANRDTIKGFEIARDILQVGADETAAATTANTAPSNSVVSATAAAHTLADVDFIEFAFEANSNADLSASTDGTELLKAISNSTNAATLNVDTDDDATYVLAYDGGNAYLYYVSESNDAGVAVAAGDVALVATVEGIGVGDLAAANFDLVA